MTRILITGASGFAGHHCLEHVLAETDWDVIATASFRHRGTCDRIVQVLRGDRRLDMPGISRISWAARTTVLTHDLTAPFSPQEAGVIAGEDGLDYLIGMASMSHVDTSITDPVTFCENNLAVALNTLELARQLRPKAVVMISTDEVYGPCPPGYGHREWSPILPSNPYAASKAAQEAVAVSYWRTYGVPVIITNTMNLVGERQHAEKFVPKVLRAVLAGEEAVIHGSPGHIGSRHYLHARNMAGAVLFLLRETQPAAFPAHVAASQRSAAYRRWQLGGPRELADRPDRYNIASADRIDNLQLAQWIADAAGMPLRYRLEDFHRTRPGHDPHYGLDPGKITALGWKPPVPFRESLIRTVHWTMRNPEWLAG
jgi:dTDP-glucose 4,6-dehydratase